MAEPVYMKRVLITVHKFFPDHKAGTEVLALNVAKELQRRGWEVLVVSGNPPDVDARRLRAGGQLTSDYEYEGLRVHVIEEALRLKGHEFSHEYFHPEIKVHFAQLLDGFAPDILHIFHAQNLSASIIEAASERKIPSVASTTDFWFVCPVVQLKRLDGAICRGPEQNASNCLHCYTPRLFPPVSEFQEAVKTKYKYLSLLSRVMPSVLSSLMWQSLMSLYKAMKAKAARQATIERPGVLLGLANQLKAIMVPTRLMADIFVENGIDARLIHHVPFGVDTESLTPYQNKHPSKTLRIGYIGTLFEHKGVDLLIQAFLQVGNKYGENNVPACLKIYGDLNQFPDYGQKLVRLASESPSLKRQIIFAGTFPNSQMGEVLSHLDVLVVPSRWYENTPLVLQSALSTKTPVVATDLGGLAELIKHDVNGLLFPLNDVDALACQLDRLIAEPGLVDHLREGICAQKTVAEMVDDIEAIYKLARQSCH